MRSPSSTYRRRRRSMSQIRRERPPRSQAPNFADSPWDGGLSRPSPRSQSRGAEGRGRLQLGRFTHKATAVMPMKMPTTSPAANPLRKTSITTCASLETRGGTGLLGNPAPPGQPRVKEKQRAGRLILFYAEAAAAVWRFGCGENPRPDRPEANTCRNARPASQADARWRFGLLTKSTRQRGVALTGDFEELVLSGRDRQVTFEAKSCASAGIARRQDGWNRKHYLVCGSVKRVAVHDDINPGLRSLGTGSEIGGSRGVRDFHDSPTYLRRRVC
jgi:hypothetical protein